MAHASWKAHLRLSLVTVPVQAYNAETAAKGDVSFNQLHDECKSRIKYVKTCPIHGEVPNNEIVKGFEYTKGEYVIVDTDELDALRGKSENAVDISAFVSPDAIDPKYFDGRTYYLLPDGPLARRPYAVLVEVLAKKKKKLWGFAVATIANREQLLVLRVVDGALCAESLHYAAELRGVAELGMDMELPKVDKEEVRLASMLVDASTKKDFDVSAFKDEYNSQVRELLEAKVAGREVVAPPMVEHEAPVVNLMEALKRSISQSKTTAARSVAKATLSRQTGKVRKPAAKRKSAG
jgi:DNA end-binding protein Ku